MTQALTTSDRYLADFQTFERGLSPERPDWLQELRQRALSRFSELGFPTARRGNERWKYTNVGPIAKTLFSYPFDRIPEGDLADLQHSVPWDDGWLNLVFVNGRYSQALSTGPAALNGVRVTSLAEAIAANSDLVQKHLGWQATFEDDGFTALNTAFLQDGAFVHIPEDESFQTPLHLIFVTPDSAQPAVSHPRTLIVAGGRSQATIIESYVGLSPRSLLHQRRDGDRRR